MSHLTTLDRIFRGIDPNSSASTIRTYVSCINSLCKKANLKPSPEDFCDKYDKVMEHLSVMKDTTQKAYLAACIKFIKDTDDEPAKQAFSKMFYEMKKKVQKEIEKQEPTPQFQELLEADFTWKTVLDYQKAYENEYLADLYNPNAILSKSLRWKLQQLILLSCYTYIEPRRAQDFCDFVLRDPTEEDNYMTEVDGKYFFVFNSYKTAKVYGQQRIEVPKKLSDMILRWTQISNTKHLLMLYKRSSPMNPPNLCHMLYEIFEGRKVSVNLLRHLYLAQYAQQDSKMKEIARRMGHSVAQQHHYIYHPSHRPSQAETQASPSSVPPSVSSQA